MGSDMAVLDSFAKKGLKNENRDLDRKEQRQANREIGFDKLGESDLLHLAVTDRYDLGYNSFYVLGFTLLIDDDTLAMAIKSLLAKQQLIILLAYVFGFNDREIGEKLNIPRYSVNRTRRRSLKQLRKYMEEHDYDDY